MKANEILRSVIDLIDTIEAGEEVGQPVAVIEPNVEPTFTSPITAMMSHAGDDIRRFQQIVDLTNASTNQEFSNSYNPTYAGLDSVTVNAGGGMNSPKHPRDIRIKDVSAYPETLDQPDTNDKHLSHMIMIKKISGNN
jgi:hypothetical protein